SNDVSILFGTGTVNANGSVGNWSTKIGPRLKAGQGPQSVILQDVAHLVPDASVPGGFRTVLGGDGKLDLLVTNSQSNNTYTIGASGGGFFGDGGPIITPGLSGQILAGPAGFFFVNAQQGVISFVADLGNLSARTDLTGFDDPSGVGGDFNGDGITD